MRTHTIIAIDGPAASGKGTLTRRLSAHFGYPYLDTGALYRYAGVYVLNAGKNPDNESEVAALAQQLADALKPEMLQNPDLRTDAAGQAASQVAKGPKLRAALLQYQKDFAYKPQNGIKGVILDGRDIGTVICPDADVKFFVTASVEVRAKRRLAELTGKNIAADFGTVLAEMKMRDARDSGRADAPLKPADDGHIIDTSDMDADAAFAAALAIINGK